MKKVWNTLGLLALWILNLGSKKNGRYAIAVPLLLIITAITHKVMPNEQVLLFAAASMGYFFAVKLICKYYACELRALMTS